jgi:hypothetical protein
MKDLRIGMPILATTTCRLRNEIIQIHPTTLVDAYTSNNKLHIKLGAGYWGACPTRDRDEVFINSGEVLEYAKRRLSEYVTENAERINNKKLIFIVDANACDVSISALSYSRKVESLAEGSFTEFTGSYASIKVRDKLPSNVFYSLDDAIEYFVKVSKQFLR